MSATVRDIARLAGVSISTVSRVLNDMDCVDDATRERVKRVMNEQGYVRRPRVKPSDRARTVCIVLSDDTDRSIHSHPTVYTILGGLTSRLTELNIGNSLFMLGDAERGAGALLSAKADGYIFIRTRREQEDIVIPKLLEQRNAPVMAVNRLLDDQRVSYVNLDDYAAVCHATEHLIKLGHRRIGFVMGEESLRNSTLRRDGYLAAMKQHGLEVDGEFELAGPYSEDYGKRAAREVLRLEPERRPTGLLTASDVIALGVQKQLLKSGLRLPEDMSVVGFGDVELAAYINPPLTTVRIPAREMGIQAANAINYLMQSPSIMNIKILMKSELCIRGSTMAYSPNGFE